MLRHLSKLIWKRKARNLMLSLEILLAFAVVFAIAAMGVRSWQLYSLPLGFTSDDVWAVTMEPVSFKEKFSPELYQNLARGLKALPGVREVGFSSGAPFEMGRMSTDIAVPGSAARIETDLLEVSDEYAAVLGVQPLEGRLFGRIDDGAAATPVIINRRLAQAMFGERDPVGQTFDAAEKRSTKPEMMRVAGLVEDLRKGGELDAPGNLMIMRHVPGVTSNSMYAILIKMAPGTPRSAEEAVQRQLKMIQKDWTFRITTLADARQSLLRTRAMPLMVLSVIAAFLLAMVAFGLFGVLWQNTTRRIPEIGLRRAIGASSGDIYRQIIAEQFLLSSVAIAAALLLLVQLPVTGALGESLNWSVFGAAAALSALVIYLLSLVCSIYPGWRASRLSPTEALHYE